MGDKGWGLVATQTVEAGSFVMEYVGRAPACTSSAISLNLACML